MRLPRPALLHLAPSRPALPGLAVLVALLLLAPALPAAASEPVALAGAVRVTASTTGRVPVVVPADATVDLSRGVRVEGEGRFTGVLLVEPGTTDGLVLRGVRGPAQAGWGPLDPELQLAAGDRTWDAATCTGTCPVPAGRYDLYVVADGTPVRVELDLDGLAGEVAIDDAQVTPVPSAQLDGWPGGTDTFYPWGSVSWSGPSLAMPAGGMALGSAAITISTRTLATALVDLCARVDDGGCQPMARDHLTATPSEPASARLVGLVATPPGSVTVTTGTWFATAVDFAWWGDQDMLLLGW